MDPIREEKSAQIYHLNAPTQSKSLGKIWSKVSYTPL